MGDMREVFDQMREDKKERKEAAREENERVLVASGLPWVKKNDGAHWMLRGGPDVDVYPGTGRWRCGKTTGRGVSRLLKLMGVR